MVKFDALDAIGIGLDALGLEKPDNGFHLRWRARFIERALNEKGFVIVAAEPGEFETLVRSMIAGPVGTEQRLMLALAQGLDRAGGRIVALEKNSHEPIDFTDIYDRLQRLETRAGISGSDRL